MTNRCTVLHTFLLIIWGIWRKRDRDSTLYISGTIPFISTCSGFVFRVEKDSPALLEEPILKAIAKKHNRSPGQVALRYQVEREVVVLAKSFNEKRIKENFEVQAGHCLSRVGNGCCTGGHLSCLSARTHVHSFPCMSPCAMRAAWKGGRESNGLRVLGFMASRPGFAAS